MGNNDTSQFLQQLRDSLEGAEYSTTAIYASIAIAFGGSLVVVCIVLLIWHPLRTVYAPQKMEERKEKIMELQAARQFGTMSAETLQAQSWATQMPKLRNCLTSCFRMKDTELIGKRGLDAFIYILALKMMRNIFLVFTFVTFVIICPINVVYNLKQRRMAESVSKTNSLLLLTPIFLANSTMAAHLVLGYFTNTVVFAFVFVNYKHVIRHREALMKTPEYNAKAYHRTVMLLNLPKTVRNSQAILQSVTTFNATNTGTVNTTAMPLSATMGRDTSKVRKLTEDYGKKLRRYERLLTDKDTKRINNPIFMRLKKVESEDEKNLKILKLKRELATDKKNIELERTNNVSTTTNYGFVTFSQAKHAIELCKKHENTEHVSHSAISAMSGGNGIRVLRASPPDQLIWANMTLTEAERGTKQLFMNILYLGLVVCWIVPSAFIGCFISNLNRLAVVWPAFNEAMQGSPVGFAILQGILAPTITTLVFSALPYIFRQVSSMQGKVTRVDREQEVLRKLYAFFFFDNLFVFSIMGVIWDIVTQVISSTQSTGASSKDVWDTLHIAQRIASAIINVSTFWVVYILRNIFGVYMNAAQPMTLLAMLGRRMNFIKPLTPREKKEEAEPAPFQFAVNFLHILFNATIALTFTTIQPLVLPVAALLFGLAAPIKKYELVNVAVTKYESNGAFWPMICDILIFSLLFGNAILFCILWVQANWRMACGTIPLMVSAILFKLFVYFKFDTRFNFPDLPVDTSLNMQSESPTQFLDPILTKDLETVITGDDDDPEIGNGVKLRTVRTFASDSSSGSSLRKEDDHKKHARFSATDEIITTPLGPDSSHTFNNLMTTTAPAKHSSWKTVEDEEHLI